MEIYYRNNRKPTSEYIIHKWQNADEERLQEFRRVRWSEQSSVDFINANAYI